MHSLPVHQIEARPYGVTNCIIYYNAGGNYSGSFSFQNCCTIPLPSLAFGTGDFTNEPNFFYSAYLQSNSPCINAGYTTSVTSTSDLDGRPRIADGTVDVGSYEFQGTNGLFIPWLYQNGLPTDGSADYIDSDGDGLSNWQEWKAGTIPTNAISVLQMSSPSNNVFGVTVRWQSVTNVTYYLQRSADLSATSAFSSIVSNLVGQAGTTSYTDTTATNASSYFYRVGVQY